MTEFSVREKLAIRETVLVWRVVGEEGFRREADTTGYLSGRSPCEERNVTTGH
jgi:hypothetical protein